MTTYDELNAALVGESLARNKYRKFAAVAKKDGHFAISKIFEETSENEYEHASMIMKLMGDVIGKDTADCLQKALDGETYEWTKMYPGMRAVAQKEGKKDAADYFGYVIVAEQHHAKRYANLLKMLKEGTLYKSDKPEKWFCTNCGYIHTGKDAPKECPNCKHEQGYFIRKCMLEYGEQ